MDIKSYFPFSNCFAFSFFIMENIFSVVNKLATGSEHKKKVCFLLNFFRHISINYICLCGTLASFSLNMIPISSSLCLANECIFHEQAIEDKVYVQPENVYLSSDRIYLRIDEDFIPIQNLSCDSIGLFVSIQDIEIGRGRRETWICPNPDCGYENYDGIDYCGLCGTYRYSKGKKNNTLLTNLVL